MSPLTTDQNALLEVVSRLSVESIRQELPGFSGTAIGDGLLLGSESFSKEGNRKKVMILLTDGEANVGIDPKSAVLYTRERSIRIHAIGLGSPAGTDLYTTDSFGRKQYFLDVLGKPIRARIDEALMGYIASTTGGKYANALSEKDLERIFADIDTLEKAPISETKYISRPLGQFLLPPLFLCMGIFLFFERRRLGSPYIQKSHL
jgi:Ca-activated chloride channel homolog